MSFCRQPFRVIKINFETTFSQKNLIFYQEGKDNRFTGKTLAFKGTLLHARRCFKFALTIALLGFFNAKTHTKPIFYNFIIHQK